MPLALLNALLSIQLVSHHRAADVSLVGERGNGICDSFFVLNVRQSKLLQLMCRKQKLAGHIIADSLNGHLRVAAANPGLAQPKMRELMK